MSCYCGKTRKRPNFGIHFLDVFDEINSRFTTVPYSLEQKKCVFPSTVSGPAGCFCLFVCLWPLHIIGLRATTAYLVHTSCTSRCIRSITLCHMPSQFLQSCEQNETQIPSQDRRDGGCWSYCAGAWVLCSRLEGVLTVDAYIFLSMQPG